MSEGDAPLLEIEDLVVGYRGNPSLLGRHTARVNAVAGVSLTVRSGETLGLVGESGCGKTTVARAIVGLVPVTAGSIRVGGMEVGRMSSAETVRWRREVQMVFQDPYSSLDPRMTTRGLISEPWTVHPDLVPAAARNGEVERLLALVGLDPVHAGRYPHQLSGGQRQRVMIARALALHPRLLICDEPVSALDASIQAQIINLLIDLQAQLGLSYLFISHDLSVVRHVSQRLAVMYLGKIAEEGRTEDLFSGATHPYTAALLSAALPMTPWQAGNPERIVLHGDVASPADPPSGCRFHPRCWRADEQCRDQIPVLAGPLTGHRVSCHHPLIEAR